jgi:hypothetical protein
MGLINTAKVILLTTMRFKCMTLCLLIEQSAWTLINLARCAKQNFLSSDDEHWRLNFLTGHSDSEPLFLFL